MTVKMQKTPQKNIAKPVTTPVKPMGEGMGMSPIHRLGKYAHPKKKK